ncbi:hypothetical protein GPECTOR_8g120 [Gonium pectorale]|uniref:Uncharacterized protein n=1 Tax=Gonium pectorale TaxID=33097 RepID=A0A150GSA4_GONPE|nr:hypothetical protein GPECTOR_8g120 [Gonium pectorale]|eukprot:KXZ52727.1 hypothetical protein GPECTOR_8g120 [Gonium pectorale]
MLGQMLSTANTVRKMATGESGHGGDEQHKLTDYLATLVTYPGLYILATAGAAEAAQGQVNRLRAYLHPHPVSVTNNTCSHLPGLAGSVGLWLESFADAAPPLALEGVVEAAVVDAREGDRAEAASLRAGAGPTVRGGPAAVGWEGGLPLRRLAAAAAPNLSHVSRQLQQRYRLSRGRTWLEFTQAGAVLLLRLLAWKRVALCTSSAEALKYVFVMGQQGAGRATAFARLTHLPLDYQVPPSVPAEIRPLARLPGAFAVLPAGLDSSDPRVAARAGHFANLEHGVFSVLVYVVSCESAPDPALLAPAVWQSLAAHKPTLLLLSKGVKMTEAINVRAGGRADPRAAEALAAGWQSVLHEGAARRGLDADSASVVVAELRDSAPPGGVAGLSQVRDWLAAALEAATQR